MERESEREKNKKEREWDRKKDEKYYSVEKKKA